MKEKTRLLSRKDMVFIVGMALTVIISMCISLTANAASGYTKPTEINSNGVVKYDANGDGDYDDEEDIYLDAQDIYYLYNLCK